MEYKHIKSKPFLCLATILSSIIRYHTGKIFNQNQIAEYFGVHVPINYIGPIKNVKRTKKENKWGIILKPFSIKKFFQDNKIELTEKYISIFEMEDWRFIEIIKNNLLTGASVFCGFDYGSLFTGGGNNFGHISLILGIDKNNILLLDPGPYKPGIKKVDYYDLYKAIHKKEAGLWIIAKQNQK